MIPSVTATGEAAHRACEAPVAKAIESSPLRSSASRASGEQSSRQRRRLWQLPLTLNWGVSCLEPFVTALPPATSHIQPKLKGLSDRKLGGASVALSTKEA